MYNTGSSIKMNAYDFNKKPSKGIILKVSSYIKYIRGCFDISNFRMWHKIVLYLACSYVITMPAYSEDLALQSAENYVQQLVQAGSSILNDNTITEEARLAKARILIVNNLDFDWMARYTLGSYRKTLSQEQINEFVAAYTKYVSKAYTNLVKNYKEQKGKVERISPLDKGEFIVEMTILNNKDQAPIKVNYLVRQVQDQGTKYNWKVSDVITEGVSLINSQQQEFVSMIANEGFDKLMSELVKKS